MGFMVLVYNGDYGWDDVLGMYKERELVEKMFRSLEHIIIMHLKSGNLR